MLLSVEITDFHLCALGGQSFESCETGGRCAQGFADMGGNLYSNPWMAHMWSYVFRRRLYSCLTPLAELGERHCFPSGMEGGGSLPPVEGDPGAQSHGQTGGCRRPQAGWLSWEPQVCWMVWGHLESSTHGHCPCQPHSWEELRGRAQIRLGQGPFVCPMIHLPCGLCRVWAQSRTPHPEALPG